MFHRRLSLVAIVLLMLAATAPILAARPVRSDGESRPSNRPTHIATDPTPSRLTETAATVEPVRSPRPVTLDSSYAVTTRTVIIREPRRATYFVLFATSFDGMRMLPLTDGHDPLD
jgi:hypothetical protein